MPVIALADPADDMKRVTDLRGQWRFSIGDDPRWANPSYDDSGWERIFVPAPWEDEGFSGFDGYAWYRTTVDLRNISENNLYLILGYIDDVDQVFINGEMIGFSGSFPPDFYTAFNSHRKYYIPPELINKNGKNVIAVRVYDTILDGGIIKGNVGIYANRKEPKNTLLLEGIWKFREGNNQWWKEPDYDDSYWSATIVPGFWRSFKKAHIQGEAWYRKEFVLPDYLQNENQLVLVLGLIDDFDQTYLNGVLIGRTNDGKSFGQSDSWRTYRTYKIPKDLLKRNGTNIIAVRVKDIGGNAGIYKGPLGIVPFSDYKELINSQRY